MKVTTFVYAALVAIGLTAVMAVPVLMDRSGSAGVPFWNAAVMPGPLSAAHAFIDARCESCHTPTGGVGAASCLTCHATAAPQLLTKTSTAFHANIGECAGCHVEHQGRNRRPINMDHAVLATAGHARTAEAELASRPPNAASFRHSLAQLQILLNGSGGDLVGGTLTPQPLPASTLSALNCGSCHVSRDVHRTLFGRDCHSCHNVNAWTVAAYVHPSPRSQDCVQCHQAPPSHYMMHFEMMDRAIAGQPNARVEQCFLCHQTDAWNNIRGVGWREMH